jgi:Kef-type K+ transport system membrane component KefB
MRRVLIIGLLFLLMSALPLLQVRIAAPFHPQSLATLGFVLLAAYTLGELSSRFSLPKITGYIITGLIFGPSIVNLFSVAVVEDLKLINNLAIGLIALTAGAEMRLSGLKAVARSLGWITLVKGLVILAAITATVFAARPLIPFLASAPAPLALAVGMIFGVLAIGTSPAATIAVINETGARGRLSDITLGTAVAKDVVMIILLAVAISLASLFAAPGAVFDPTILLQVGEELALSVLVGALLGGVVIVYIRYVHAEMWLFIIGIIFLNTALAEQFHLEALLTFIVAGFVVQNFSRYGDEFIHPVEEVSLPVYVVFFSITGAGLDLRGLQQVWLVALILVGVRLMAIYAGTRLAVALAQEVTAIRRNAWLSFISQAGVVIGLSIIVESKLPGLGAEIKTIVLGTIGINLILGPIAFKIALARAGETREARSQRASQAGAAESADGEDPAMLEAALAETPYPRPDFSAPELTYAALELSAQLASVQRECEQALIDPLTERWQSFISRMRDHCLQTIDQLAEEARANGGRRRRAWIHLLRESRAAFSRWLQEDLTILLDKADAAASKHAFQKCFSQLDALPAQTKDSILIPQEPERFQRAPEDSFYIRRGKQLKRGFRVLRRLFGADTYLKREVPLSALVKYHFAGTLPPRLIRVANLLGAQPLTALRSSHKLYAQIDAQYETIITWLEERGDPHPAEAELGARLAGMRHELAEKLRAAEVEQERFGAGVKGTLTRLCAQTYAGLLEDLAIAGTFELPPRRFRYAKTVREREKAFKEMAQSGETWRTYQAGFVGSFTKHLEAIQLVDRVSRAVDDTVFSVLESIDANLAANLRAAQESCTQSRRELAAALTAEAGAEASRADSLSAIQRELTRHRAESIQFVRGETLKKLRRLRDSRELNALIEIMLQRFAALADELPERCRVLDEKYLALPEALDHRPPEIKLQVIPLRAIARAYLETEIARDLAEVNRIMFEQVDETIQTVTEASQIINFNLQVALDELTREPEDGEPPGNRARARELALNGYQLALNRLDAALEKIGHLKRQIYEQIIVRVDVRMRELEARAFQRAAESPSPLKPTPLLTEGARYLQRAARWLEDRYRRAVVKYGPLSRAVVKDLKTTLGEQPFTATELLTIYDQARLDQARLQHLPFIYRKLFDIAPLESADFLIAREQELNLIETARARWQQGMPCSVAVVGELGSGKTSLINAAIKEVLGDYPIYKMSFTRTVESEEQLAGELAQALGLPPVHSFDELQELLADTAQRSVIVLEDAHQLYLRALGGFECLRQLLLLIARTSHQVFWILSMRKYAWRYLDAVLRISDSFTFVVQTENLSGQELGQVILSRHQVSGFDLRFLPDEIMEQRSKYRKAPEKERQALLRGAYFDALSKASEGNILAAIFYWLKSLLELQGHALLISPLPRLNFDFLREMPVEKLLTLSMLIQHGNLTAPEHARIFRTDLRASLSTLTYLTNLNLLTNERGENGDECFAVNRVLYIPLTRELRARNILPQER